MIKSIEERTKEEEEDTDLNLAHRLQEYIEHRAVYGERDEENDRECRIDRCRLDDHRGHTCVVCCVMATERLA